MPSTTTNQSITTTANNNNSRKVLSEEEYNSTLTNIISRDYYPSLPSLRRDLAILNKRSVGDIAGAVAIRRAARQLENHQQLQKESETVDEFHSRATSEDNHEFEIRQCREITVRKELFERVFDAPRLEQRIENGEETPLLASDQFDPPLVRRNVVTEEKRNALFFTPRLLPHSSSSSDGRAVVTAAIAAGEKLPALEHQTAKKRTKRRDEDDVVNDDIANEQRLMMPPPPKKRIDPSQTRFPHQTNSRLPPVTPQTTHQQQQQPVSGIESDTTDLDASPLPLAEERMARANMIRNQRNTFVAMTPNILPGQRHENDSPIITWGNVASTPLLIPNNNDSFDVKEDPNQNIADLAHSMLLSKSEKQPQKTRPQQSSSKPTSSSSLADRTASLTPAAKSLLAKTAGNSSLLRSKSKTPSVRSSSAFGSALRESYTPKMTPRSKRAGSSSTPMMRASTKDTMVDIGKRKNSGGNITDGLLHLN